MPTDSRLKKTDFGDFDRVNKDLKRLIDNWQQVVQSTERNRERREPNIDIAKLRKEGKINSDETYTPVHQIDSNIRFEKPQYLSYLTQSNRAVIFAPPQTDQDLTVIAQRLEKRFTFAARYDQWQVPFVRCIDSMQLHGWGVIEVSFDVSKPGHFSLEHVSREDLVFDIEAANLESQEFLLRRTFLTAMELRVAIDGFGFRKEAVEQLLEGTDDEVNRPYEVYKVFFKEDGVVKVAWYHPRAHEWVKPPEDLFLGRRDFTQDPVEDPDTGMEDFPPLQETEYPFYELRYIEKEDDKITSQRGRAEIDFAAQDAASVLQTSFVNGSKRATEIYGSVTQSASDAATPKDTDIKLKPFRIYDKPINFFNTPYPQDSVLRGQQAVTTQNRSEQAQVDFAVRNRQDSEKTATEIQAAQQEAARLSNVQVTQLSIFIQLTYTRCWHIYSNRILQGKLPFPEDLIQFLMVDFHVKPAGDVDVIERAEELQQRRQDWAVFQATPIANIFLQDLVKLAYPRDAERYIQAMQQEQQKNQLIGSLYQMTQSLALDDGGNLTNEAIELGLTEEQLGQLGEAVQAITGNQTAVQQQQMQPQGR